MSTPCAGSTLVRAYLAAQTRRNLHRQDPAFGAATGVRVTDDDAYNANLGVRGSNVLDGGGLDHDLYWGVRASQERIPDQAGLYENVGNIRTDGIDIVVGYDWGALSERLKGLSLEGSVTWQDAEMVDAVNPANDGNEVPYAWEEKAAWSLQYETEDLWRFSLGGVHVGGSYSDEANTAAESANGDLGLNPSRTLWDTQISREGRLVERAHARIALGATNVFDEDWYVHSRGGFFEGGKVAGPPRQLYMSLQLSL